MCADRSGVPAVVAAIDCSAELAISEEVMVGEIVEERGHSTVNTSQGMVGALAWMSFEGMTLTEV